MPFRFLDENKLGGQDWKNSRSERVTPHPDLCHHNDAHAQGLTFDGAVFQEIRLFPLGQALDPLNPT